MGFNFSQAQRIAGGIKSGQVRALKAEQKRKNKDLPPLDNLEQDTKSNPYAIGLASAQEELLASLRASTKAKDPKSIAACARALREVRETWHMVTGEPRPGIRRESGRRQRPEPSGPAFSLPGEVQAQAQVRTVRSQPEPAPSVPGTTTASVGQVQLQAPSTTSAEPIKP